MKSLDIEEQEAHGNNYFLIWLALKAICVLNITRWRLGYALENQVGRTFIDSSLSPRSLEGCWIIAVH